MTTREAPIVALGVNINGAYAWAAPLRRRLKLWNEVPASEKPCAFLIDHGDNYIRQAVHGVRTIDTELWIYIDAKDPEVVGSIVLNTIMDGIDAAIAPSPAEPGRQTLGGLASEVFIEGEVFKDPGDIDGDGLMIVPIKIRLP